METVSQLYGLRLNQKLIELRYELNQKKVDINFAIRLCQDARNTTDNVTFEHLHSISKMIENIKEAIIIGEKIILLHNNQHYQEWVIRNIAKPQYDAQKKSDEIELLLMKQTGQNTIDHMKNFTN
jgi:hypothetical protein